MRRTVRGRFACTALSFLVGVTMAVSGGCATATGRVSHGTSAAPHGFAPERQASLVMPSGLHTELAVYEGVTADIGHSDPLFTRNDGSQGQQQAAIMRTERVWVDYLGFQRAGRNSVHDYLLIRTRIRRGLIPR